MLLVSRPTRTKSWPATSFCAARAPDATERTWRSPRQHIDEGHPVSLLLISAEVDPDTRRTLQRDEHGRTALSEIGMPEHHLVPAAGGREVPDRRLTDRLAIEPDRRPWLRVDRERRARHFQRHAGRSSRAHVDRSTDPEPEFVGDRSRALCSPAQHEAPRYRSGYLPDGPASKICMVCLASTVPTRRRPAPPSAWWQTAKRWRPLPRG